MNGVVWRMIDERRVIRVMVADSCPCVCEGLASLVGRCSEMAVVGQASNCGEAKSQWHMLRPDVTVMDIRMPDCDAAEAISALRGECRQARVLVLTELDGEEDIYRALQAGARGYLLKEALGDEIIAAIRSVHAGKKVIPPKIAAKLSQRLKAAKLTAREQDVLRALASGGTNQEIAMRLFISEGTVKTHINNILSKMDVKDRTQALIAGIKRGLLHWP